MSNERVEIDLWFHARLNTANEALQTLESFEFFFSVLRFCVRKLRAIESGAQKV